MKKTIPLMLLLLMLLSPAYALFGFDEFNDDNPQLIQETVEGNDGSTCTTCNMSLWINYPNGTLYGNFYMTYNSSASKWQKQLNLTLVNENTTIYGVTINGTLDVSSNTRNATSDRTQITIYDIFPQEDSLWDIGLVILFLTIQWTFILLAYRFFDEHVMVKYTFILIALFFNSWLMALGHRILIINGVITSNFTRLFDSTQVLD